MNKPQDYYYRHARGHRIPGKGGARLDMTYVARVQKDSIHVAVTVCSKSDIYTKETGRNIATERLKRLSTHVFPRMCKKHERAANAALIATEALTHKFPKKVQELIRAKEIEWEQLYPVAAQKRRIDIQAKLNAIKLQRIAIKEAYESVNNS